MFETLKELSQPVIGLAGVVVAVLLFRLNSAVRRDNWARTLREFHHAFWNDESIRQVREWIALDASYADVRDAFAKRNKGESVTATEYEKLEKVDKFAALLLAYKQVSPTDWWHKKASRRLFDEYWLRQLTRAKRPELREYFERYYEELVSDLP